jgi:putative acetyltransferase
MIVLEPAMIDLRDESPHDQKAIFHVVSCAFGQLAEAQLIEELRDPGDIIVSLVADEDGQVVSHVLLS